MRVLALLSVVSFALLSGCTYDEECRDVVVPEADGAALVKMERCGLRHCARLLRVYQRQELSFRLPSAAGQYRLEDLHAEDCSSAGSADEDCKPVTGSLLVRTVQSPAEHNPLGRLDADVTVDVPSSFAGTEAVHYSERWGSVCHDIDWPDMGRIF